ncbi:MAG: ATP-binding protein [Pirellulales bacterium]|nr:ATP-binding protein [Pirellulales bacterium]
MDENVVCIRLPRDAPDGAYGTGNSRRANPVDNPFFVGPENDLVPVAVQAVLDDAATDRPSRKYNPLVFFGATGTGKSHLVRGLAAAYRARLPAASVVCVAAADFAREYADAIETQSVEEFRRRHGRARLLVVEDVTLLADRPAAQRELIQAVDAALAAGRRVIATAGLPPGQWPQIAPALQSRLAAGLSVGLASPERATRQAILRELARQRDVVLPEPAVELLAAALKTSVRLLMGAVGTLAADSRATGRTIDVDAVRRFLARKQQQSQVDLREIAAVTARCFGLTVTQLRSRTRRREVVTARGVAMYLARQLTNENLERIGDYFGGRDHTTVLHGCRKTETLLQTEPSVQQAVVHLRCKLHAS